MKDENYRPAAIEFDVAHDGSLAPETLGTFPTAEDAAKYIGKNLVVVNQALTVSRHMDNKEKNDLRREYSDILENILPVHAKDLSRAENQLAEAKKMQKAAEELYNGTVTSAKQLAAEVKRGLVDIRLDELFTYRVTYKGRYYYYTYMDKQLKLCQIRDIPEFEKSELWNSMAQNEEFIDSLAIDKMEEQTDGSSDN
jgi:hypothetical protein